MYKLKEDSTKIDKRNDTFGSVLPAPFFITIIALSLSILLVEKIFHAYCLRRDEENLKINRRKLTLIQRVKNFIITSK